MKKESLLMTIAILIIALSSVAQVTGTFKDLRNGKVYKTVKIGKQTWFAENLAFKADSGCCAYQNNDKFAAIYGYLYNFRVAQKACPLGWHLPNDAEWNELFEYLGGRAVAGAKLKAKSRWNTTENSFIKPDSMANNSSGFNALPGGYRYLGDTVMTETGFAKRYKQTYDKLGMSCDWWAGYCCYKDVGNNISLYYNKGEVLGGASNANYFYVRCIKE
jgi:uncharacterized protein (TIGR02145 family)